MSSSSSSLVFKVLAETSSATAGLKRFASSLTGVQKSADKTNAALGKIGAKKATLTVNDRAIQRAKSEITRLQDQMGKDLALDVNADTTQAQRRIRQLQSSIKALQRSKITPTANVSGLTRLKNGLTDLAGGLKKVGGGFADVFKSVGIPVIGAVGAAAVGVAAGVGALAIKALTLADAMEVAKKRFDVFTGSAKKTAKIIGDTRKYADTTPFEFPELQSAALRLTQLGGSAKDINTQLKMMGDIAAASGASVDDLTRIYAQMQGTGKITTEDMNQLIDAGVTSWKELAKALGVSETKIKKFVEEGKAGKPELDKFWDALAGKRKGATKSLGETLGGQLGTLKDTLNGILTDIGNALLPLVKQIVPQIQKATEGLGTKIGAALPGWIEALLNGASSLIDVGGTIMGALKSVTTGFLYGIGDFQRGMGMLLSSLGGFITDFGGLVNVLSPLTGVLLTGFKVTGQDLQKAGDDLYKAGDKTKLAAAQLHINWNKWIEEYKVGAGKAKTAIEGAKISSALIFSTGKAQTDVDTLKKKLDKINGTKANPIVNAKTEKAEAKLKTAQAWLDQLAAYTADPKLLATDLASGKVAYVKGELVKIDQAAPTATINADGTPATNAYATAKGQAASWDTTSTASQIAAVAGPASQTYLNARDMAVQWGGTSTSATLTADASAATGAAGDATTAYGNVPGKVSTTVEVTTGGSVAAISGVADNLRKLPKSKSIKLTVSTKGAAGAASAVSKAVRAVPKSKVVKITAVGRAGVAGANSVSKAVKAIPKSKVVKITAPSSKAVGDAKKVSSAIKAIPTKHNTVVSLTDNASGKARSIRSNINAIPSSKTVTITAHYRQTGNKSPATPSVAPKAVSTITAADAARLGRAFAAAVPAPAAPSITIHVRDEKLADLIDVRVDGRAARAAHVMGRRRGVLP